MKYFAFKAKFRRIMLRKSSSLWNSLMECIFFSCKFSIQYKFNFDSMAWPDLSISSAGVQPFDLLHL